MLISGNTVLMLSGLALTEDYSVSGTKSDKTGRSEISSTDIRKIPDNLNRQPDFLFGSQVGP